MANTNHVNRITLFKIPNEDDRQKLLELYRGMPQKAVKVSGDLMSPWSSGIPADSTCRDRADNLTF